MNTITPEEQQKIEQTLAAEKKSLQNRLQELQTQDPYSDPQRLVDNASTDTEANEESTHDRYAAMTREITLKITDIDEALKRLTDGTYGICASCGKSIGGQRLAAIPTAKYCVECGSKR